jgi:hypothetical protein
MSTWTVPMPPAALVEVIVGVSKPEVDSSLQYISLHLHSSRSRKQDELAHRKQTNTLPNNCRKTF